MHLNKGKTLAQCLHDRTAYAMNSEKTNEQELISSYECDPRSIESEFLLAKREYQILTGRAQKNDVIAYQIRQSFKPGEITPEAANAVGMELAGRLTGDRHAYVVATHIDKHHVHNHIIICSIDLEGRHKYRDVKRSAKDLANISDEICREHGLSVIRNPQERPQTYDKWQGNQKKSTMRDTLRMMIDAALRCQPDGFDALMQLLEETGCLIKRGAHVSMKPPDGKRYIRLDSLGPEYDEESLRKTLSGKHVHVPRTPGGDYTDSQVKQLINIENKLRSGKGKGYEVWAERHNIDAMAQSVIYLKEHQIESVEELDRRIQTIESAKNGQMTSIREKRTRMQEINRKRKAIRDYGRTKETYSQFRESGWSTEFYNAHREEIEAHREAQEFYSQHGGKLPTQKELTGEYDTLREEIRSEKDALGKLKAELTNLKHIRYNYEILMRDEAPETRKRHRTGLEER